MIKKDRLQGKVVCVSLFVVLSFLLVEDCSCHCYYCFLLQRSCLCYYFPSAIDDHSSCFVDVINKIHFPNWPNTHHTRKPHHRCRSKDNVQRSAGFLCDEAEQHHHHGSRVRRRNEGRGFWSFVRKQGTRHVSVATEGEQQGEQLQEIEISRKEANNFSLLCHAIDCSFPRGN